jgi:hypothetical protein
MKLKVPQLLWYGNSELELEFPDSWDVHFLPPKGHDRPKLSPQEMARAFAEPIGTQRIGELRISDHRFPIPNTKMSLFVRIVLFAIVL